MTVSNVFRGFVCLIIAVAMTGCSSCGTQNNDPVDAGGQETDGGVDTPVDDAGIEPDVMLIDTGGDVGGPDLPPDMPPTDTDGDGVPDSDDNCPEEPNEDQVDRDRDGLGDLCDRLPFVHDATNPQSIPTTVEDEVAQPNDSAAETLDFALTLPFQVNGVVGDIEDGAPDVDFYTFEIDEPTSILVHLIGNQSMWGAALLVGIDWATANAFRVQVNPNVGTSDAREIFLPYPGRYSFVVSDARNFIEAQPDVGGAGLDYRMQVSAIPLRDPVAVTLPSTPQGFETDQTLHVFELDVATVRGLRATARGIPGDDMSFFLPLLALYDPATKQTLAMNSLGQIGDDLRASLALKFRDRERLLAIVDYGQGVGTNQVSFTANPLDLATEPETGANAADSRFEDVPWVTPGESMSGTIGAPRNVPGGSAPDVDYVLFSSKRGESYKITVGPHSGSELAPLVQIGHLIEQAGESYFVPLHEAPEGPAGEGRSVEYLISATDDGEMAALIQHGPNRFGGTLVGGSSYDYDITVATEAPMPTEFPSAPFSAPVTIEAGGYGLLKFSAQMGDRFNVRSEGNLLMELRVIDAANWRVLDADYTSLNFAAPTTGDYYIVGHDFIGRGTGTTPSTISVNPITTIPLPSLPATHSGALDVVPTQMFQFSATAGQVLDVRVATETFFPAIKVFDAALRELDNTSYQDKQFIVPADGDYIVSVGSSSGNPNPTYAYTLGIEVIQPLDLLTLPATAAGVLDSEPFAGWYQFPVVAGQIYTARFSSTDPSWTGALNVVDPTSMDLIRSGRDSLIWQSAVTGNVWISVAETDNLGDPSFDYELQISQAVSQPALAGQTISRQLADGSRENLELVTVSDAMLEVVVEPVGDWRPEVRLLDASSLRGESGSKQIGKVLRYAVSASRNFAVGVRASDASQVGPLAYDVTVRIIPSSPAVPEVEPNDSFMEAQPVSGTPTVISGTVDAIDGGDRFTMPLVRWQRVWLMSTDRNANGTDRFDATVKLIDAMDTVVNSNVYSGEGYMPALYGHQVETSGAWQMYYGPRDGRTITGDYFLYLVTSAITDVAETEPNDTAMTAHLLGSVDELTRVSAFVDGTDPLDLFSISVAQSDSRVRVALENADDGHELRLLDASGMQIAASGAGFDGLLQPGLDVSNLAAGTYFVELGTGTASGAVEVLILAE